jgi:hypothetical protein
MRSFIWLKLSVFVISTKNNTHWHSNKKLFIKVSFEIKSESNLISYIFKFNVLFCSKSTDILFVAKAIY